MVRTRSSPSGPGLTVGSAAARNRAFRLNDAHSGRPRTPYLALLGFIGLCLLVGVADGTLTAAAVQGWYLSLTPPPLTPPEWIFGPVWITLYVMIGLAGWLVWRQCGAAAPVRLWGWQLAANALWTPAFFGLQSPTLGLVVMAALLALVGKTIARFWTVSRLATMLMTPYLGWCLFAAYLNTGFWWLNRG